MADDNNQDMSMEDILSSIKDILEEDAAAHAPAAVEPSLSAADESAEEQTAVSAPEAEAPVPAAGEPDNDILELSPDMRLPETEDETSADSINLDAELDGVELPELSDREIEQPVLKPSPADQAGNEETGDEEPRGVRLGWEDFESDPFYEEPTEHGDGEVIGSAEEETLPAEEILPEAPVEEITPVAEEVQHEVAAAPEPEVLPAEAAGSEIAEPEIEPQENTAAEVWAEPEPAPQEQPAAEEAYSDNTAGTVSEVAADSAVDVSASIISNFARMFSKTEPAPETEPSAPVAAAAEPVSRLGDGSKTIEDVVSSVVRQIIGDEVAAGWREGLDYDALAREEISRQTKEWLDHNLPAVVEKIVKQEIERVMAKVGSQD